MLAQGLFDENLHRKRKNLEAMASSTPSWTNVPEG
jgi:hypothetical protein